MCTKLCLKTAEVVFTHPKRTFFVERKCSISWQANLSTEDIFNNDPWSPWGRFALLLRTEKPSCNHHRSMSSTRNVWQLILKQGMRWFSWNKSLQYFRHISSNRRLKILVRTTELIMFGPLPK